MTALAALTAYYGGKAFRFAKIIANQLPPHRVYVEPFGGMAGVLMAKQPSHIEVYNDLAHGIVTLFEVVRNREDCKELERLLNLTPYSREEWRRCCQSYRAGGDWHGLTDKVEKARRIYVILEQSFNGQLLDGGWSFGGLKHDCNVAKGFYNSLSNLDAVSKRLRGVQIDCQEATKIIDRWDGDDTMLYVDPPYLWATRSQKNKGKNGYEHEMNDQQHTELLDMLLAVKSMVFLSGYPSDFYHDRLMQAGWLCQQYASIADSAVFTLGNGLKGRDRSLAKRVECLWINPAAQNKMARTLWSMSEVVNA